MKDTQEGRVQLNYQQKIDDNGTFTDKIALSVIRLK